MKGKGKAPAVQPKQSRKPSGYVASKGVYSYCEKSEILQEVLRTDLSFQDGEFTDLPLYISYT